MLPSDELEIQDQKKNLILDPVLKEIESSFGVFETEFLRIEEDQFYLSVLAWLSQLVI